MIRVLGARLDTAVCSVTSAETRSPCEKCFDPETEWHKPLNIEWYLDSKKQVGDLTSLDRSKVSRSFLVSDRLREVLQRECNDIEFFPVVELNGDDADVGPGLRPFWQAVPPLLVVDTAARGWVAGRACRKCGRIPYAGPGVGGSYLVEPADLAAWTIFEVAQLSPCTFITDELKQHLESLPFTNIEILEFPAILQTGSPPEATEVHAHTPPPPIPGVPTRDELPEDPADWSTLEISLPRLMPDAPDSCPESERAIMKYVRMESADGPRAKRKSLRFLRTAQLAEEEWWLWSYTESDGELCYVFFRQRSDGSTLLGLTSAKPDPEAPAALSPEAFMVSEYYELAYW